MATVLDFGNTRAHEQALLDQLFGTPPVRLLDLFEPPFRSTLEHRAGVYTILWDPHGHVPVRDYYNWINRRLAIYVGMATSNAFDRLSKHRLTIDALVDFPAYGLSGHELDDFWFVFVRTIDWQAPAWEQLAIRLLRPPMNVLAKWNSLRKSLEEGSKDVSIFGKGVLSDLGTDGARIAAAAQSGIWFDDSNLFARYAQLRQP